jgi:putative component of membrane protein insertase Oxa1/YidC/SpoIIIJ protein YidD
MGDESAGGRMLLDLIPALPLETCVQWRALLTHELAARHLAPTDGARLEFLISLVLDYQSTVSSTTYETARVLHAPSAPHHSTLVRAYGSWTAALRAAERLLGAAKCETVSARSSKTGYPSDPVHVIAAIVSCRDVLGDWPTCSEYLAWRRVENAVRKRTGATGAPVPHPRVAQLRFGEWAVAVRLASQWRAGLHRPSAVGDSVVEGH